MSGQTHARVWKSLWPIAIAVLLALLAGGCADANERLLLERRSAYNTILVSETDTGLRVMRFEPGGARQSVVKLDDPDHLELAYTKAMLVSLAVVPEPRRLLVIGLGGGTLPMLLHRRLPELNIDVVEIDPGVVEVARSHFGFRDDARLNVHIGDGRRFVENASARYDIIMLDAFSATDVPYVFVTREFHAAARRALTPRGIIVSNVWAQHANPLYASMLKTYEAVYDATAILDIEGAGNRIAIGGPWRPMTPKSELVQRAAKLVRALPLREDLAGLIDRGWRPIGADSATGRVLSDADKPH